MKINKPFIKAFATLIMVAVVTVSCDKDIESTETLKPLTPSDIDSDAGTWDMIVMSAPDQIAVAAPTDVESDAYKAELATIKNLQGKLTDAQRAKIEFWGAGGILRWNQILRELVTRHNLPPAPLADNTYPAPDADNPFADPGFPFANPPYAARAYSYVTVAQYEALKAAWHFKYLYNRPAPYTVDTGVKALVPKTDLPAYPSEDAVMSGVTQEMLKVLFPADYEEIVTYAADQRFAALWSGKATASDIAAGFDLGKKVADVLKARAANDGMRTAGGSPVIWKQLQDSVGNGKLYKQNQTAWITRDIPARPPMLPVFGKVQAWNLTADQIAIVRPQAPPRTETAEMKTEVEEVKHYSNNVTRERLAIVHKWADGVATYTPPGHWNDIGAEYIRDANFSEVRAARAFALLNMAMHDAAVSCWDTKFFYFNPRPSQMNSDIKTATGIPNFPAFTSGHSNFSGAGATILSYLFPEHEDFFMGEANEAALSRLYGGIHYRQDVEVGLDQGKDVAAYTLTYAETDGAD